MIDEADWARLARYFAGESSLEEANATHAWLAADEHRLRESERLCELWEASRTPQFTINSDVAWQRMAARMHVAEGLNTVALHETPRAVTRPRMHWRGTEIHSRRVWFVVAPLLAAAAALMMVRREAVSKYWHTEVVEAPADKNKEFRTARGQRAVIVLSDGSRVELGTESVLRVHPFRDSSRVVFLEGQAVFDVVHDTAHAFFVHSKNAVTEDLGTRFSIRGYPADTRVQVMVTSGKVALRAVGAPASSGTLLGPFDLGVLDAAGQTTVRNAVDTTSYLAWTRDQFYFDNAPLSEVIPEIARYFDVQIEVANPAMLQRRVHVSMKATTLRTVMGQVTMPVGLRYTIEGRTVTVR